MVTVRRLIGIAVAATLILSFPGSADARCGAISTFGGPNDTMNNGTALDGQGYYADWRPGIAVYQTSTIGGYWYLKHSNGKAAVVLQIDHGPAPWTGKTWDIGYGAMPHYGQPETGTRACGWFLPVLRWKDSNDSVKRVRRLLHRSDPTINRYRSFYDVRLRKSVWRFQKKRGLRRDGRVGPRTWAALYNVKRVD